MFEALGTAAEKTAEGADESAADDGNGSDSDLSDWDDDRMMLLDEGIAAHFSLASKAKQAERRKEEERARMDFKMRVLELIDTFIKKQPGSPLTIEVCSPTTSPFEGACPPRVPFSWRWG